MTDQHARLPPETVLAEMTWLRALVRRLVRDAHAADDVIQDTWVAHLREDPRDLEGPRLRAWLAMVARNFAWRRHRDDVLRRQHEEAAGKERAHAEGEEVELLRQQRAIADLVLDLREPYRSAVLLRFQKGLSYASIARRQGVSQEAARQRVSRGIAKLRARLDQGSDGSRGWRSVWIGWLRGDWQAGTLGTAVGVTWMASKMKVVVVGVALLCGLFWFASSRMTPVPGPAVRPAGAEGMLAMDGHPPGEAKDSPTRAPVTVLCRLRGRVVDRASGRGVAGFGIRVEENDAGQESDEQGRFSVELLLERGGILRVMPAGGWVVDVHEYHITPEVLRADKEFLVLTSPSGDSAWRFALYDAATGEPVPHFMLAAQVEHGEPIEMLSDQEGRVAVPPELGEGRLSVRCVDHPALMVQWAEETPLYTVDPPQPGGPESELRIPVGPTYRLKIEGPPELDVANLTATLESLEWVRRMERSAITGPLRAEGGHWVRFGPTPAPPHSGPPWLLQLRSSPPGLFGEVNVFQFQGVHPGLLDVQVGRVGGIAGYVWNEDDGPLLEAVVTLSVSGSDASGPLRLAPVDEGGAYRFESLRADDYRVGAVAQGYEYKDSALKVAPGQETKYDFRLARDSAFGQVSGELLSVKGEYSLPVIVVLMPQEGGVMFRRNPDWTGGEDGFVAPFVFDEVPVGDYVLRIIPSGGQLWDRYEVDVQCPASDLTFVCRDDREVSSVTIRIYDALTQKEIPAMWAFVDMAVGGSSIGQSAIGPVPSGMVIGLLVPGESTVDWVVGAPGYVPGYGDESALAEGSSPAGPILSADVHLDPGWGMLLEVLEFQRNSGGSPLSGADIYLDGVHFGKTGTDGRIRLRAAKSPERIEVQHGSTSFMSAEPFDQEGRLTSRFMLRGRVWMRGR